MYRRPVKLNRSMFATSVSPLSEGNEDVVSFLKETGVRETLIRIPSWEKTNLSAYEKIAGLLHDQNIGLTIALLQRRQDVFETSAWTRFMEEVFARFRSVCSFYEIGHAWNRTKWGVWDYTEYLKLARPAFELREKYGVKVVGPAVIDFEFHLYPPTLSVLPFDKVSSLLYVDRVGAPENAQFGWTTAMKVALFKALAESSCGRLCDCWITEVNWPLQGVGKYSPASGKPNVTEEEQANYLVRYYVICLASGLIERIYWWQLGAPGYGLMDSREKPWRRRPGFFALKTMIGVLGDATFTGKAGTRTAEIFYFEKGGQEFAVCWTNGLPLDHKFSKPVERILDTDGKDANIHLLSLVAAQRGRVKIDGSPKYVFFEP
jgi:hypothetical protein